MSQRLVTGALVTGESQKFDRGFDLPELQGYENKGFMCIHRMGNMCRNGTFMPCMAYAASPTICDLVERQDAGQEQQRGPLTEDQAW